MRGAGRVTASRPPRGGARRGSPDTVGQDADESQAAKADGKWNREETASGDRSLRRRRR